MEPKYKIGDVFSYRTATKHHSSPEPLSESVSYLKIVESEISARVSKTPQVTYRILTCDSDGTNLRHVPGVFQYINESHVDKYYQIFESC
jgi:hypothetical protein